MMVATILSGTGEDSLLLVDAVAPEHLDDESSFSLFGLFGQSSLFFFLFVTASLFLGVKGNDYSQ